MSDKAPNENVIEVEDLRVDFPTEHGLVHAVAGVSFSVKRGRVLAIVGESGSGKSVTAFSILRLIQPPGYIAGGSIKLFSQKEPPIDITSLKEDDDLLYHLRGGLVSMIFQEPMTALCPVYTVGNQICEAIHLHKDVTKKEAERIAVDMLDRVGIPKPEIRLRQYPHEFSGGMRQRVVVAMALVCMPEVLIADEPTTALDVTIQAQVLTLIKDLRKELGGSVIFITHDIGVVAQIADDVIVMNQGKILESGSVRQVLKSPVHPYTRGLLAAIPSLSQRGSRLPTIDSIPGARDIDLTVPLHTLSDGRRVALPTEKIPATTT